jgi:hypothetical protein
MRTNASEGGTPNERRPRADGAHAPMRTRHTARAQLPGRDRRVGELHGLSATNALPRTHLPGAAPTRDPNGIVSVEAHRTDAFAGSAREPPVLAADALGTARAGENLMEPRMER